MDCERAGLAAGARLDMRFLAARTVPGHVRALVELRLASWGMAALGDDMTLIASELVTNAIQHTPEQEIRVRFTCERSGALLEVWDSSNVLPVGRADAEGLGGRGLPIVVALASGCGVYRTEPYGKWVWARVELSGTTEREGKGV